MERRLHISAAASVRPLAPASASVARESRHRPVFCFGEERACASSASSQVHGVSARAAAGAVRECTHAGCVLSPSWPHAEAMPRKSCCRAGLVPTCSRLMLVPAIESRPINIPVFLSVNFVTPEN
jgi:hypothetical protein